MRKLSQLVSGWGPEGILVEIIGLVVLATCHTSCEGRKVPLTNAEAVAVGDSHSCALQSDGMIYCWGSNSHGQLGNPTQSQSLLAVPVCSDTTCAKRFSGAQQIHAGRFHTCALLSDGEVSCWGLNDHGQLGDGTTQDRQIPIQVKNLPSAVSIATGSDFSCAITHDRMVRCWGSNASGRLGSRPRDGPETCLDRVYSGLEEPCSRSPLIVPNLFGVTSIASGHGHTCVALSDGKVKCWGLNMRGQLGDRTEFDQFEPTEAAVGARAIEISTGSRHSCALLSGGSVSCWGSNTYGELGEKPRRSGLDPVPITLGVRVTRVIAGSEHTCALCADGKVRCWGYNGSGQLGDGQHAPGPELSWDGSPYTSLPIIVRIRNPLDLSPGAEAEHTCAVRANRTTKCWGRNSFGQLGNGEQGGNTNWPVTVIRMETSGRSG